MKKTINKTKLAKRLGVSRPTLYSRIKNGEVMEEVSFGFEKTAIKLAARQNNISPKDIEEILEFLSDYGYLNDEGRKFSSAFWRTFIKE